MKSRITDFLCNTTLRAHTCDVRERERGVTRNMSESELQLHADEQSGDDISEAAEPAAAVVSEAEPAATAADAAEPADASDADGASAEAQDQGQDGQSGQPEAAAAGSEGEAASFDERVHKLELVVTRHPLHREINVEILRYCLERHELSEIEEHVIAMPEDREATLDPYHLIENLERAGGLERFPLDADGEIVSPEQLEGLTEDQADDLIASYAFQTTEEGEQVVAEASPEARIGDLFEREPERADTYVELLAFFDEERRSYQSVCDLLKGRDVLFRTLGDGSRQRIQPSVFVDRLERAGAIVWDDGWVLTDEGRRVLGQLAG